MCPISLYHLLRQMKHVLARRGGNQDSTQEFVFTGTFDEAYVNQVLKIGQTHQRIGLEPRWYMDSYSLIFRGIIEDVFPRFLASGLFGRRKTGEATRLLSIYFRLAMLDMDYGISTYFEALELYLQNHGMPVAFYSDKHSVFRVAKKEAKGGQGMTQFGRALCELNIEILCANSSQAKGRVERKNRTLQDRLVKEMRLDGVTGMKAGNDWLPG
mgnify:CR=1 FL=1